MAGSFRRNCSGQVIIVSALLIALLLLSTAVYVIETEKDTPAVHAQNSNLAAYLQCAKNTLISALANITHGGTPDTLAADLATLQSILSAHSYDSQLQMLANPNETAPYVGGIWLAWSNDGTGVSSAQVSFVFSTSNAQSTSQLETNINVTSKIFVSGTYTHMQGTSKAVTLTINVLNEGKPALAQDFTVYVEADGSAPPEDWLPVASLSVTDFGNGTYVASFTAETAQRNDPVLVSVCCTDRRGILIVANATCTELG